MMPINTVARISSMPRSFATPVIYPPSATSIATRRFSTYSEVHSSQDLDSKRLALSEKRVTIRFEKGDIRFEAKGEKETIQLETHRKEPREMPIALEQARPKSQLNSMDESRVDFRGIVLRISCEEESWVSPVDFRKLAGQEHTKVELIWNVFDIVLRIRYFHKKLSFRLFSLPK